MSEDDSPRLWKLLSNQDFVPCGTLVDGERFHDNLGVDLRSRVVRTRGSLSLATTTSLPNLGLFSQPVSPTKGEKVTGCGSPRLGPKIPRPNLGDEFIRRYPVYHTLVSSRTRPKVGNHPLTLLFWFTSGG